MTQSGQDARKGGRVPGRLGKDALLLAVEIVLEDNPAKVREGAPVGLGYPLDALQKFCGNSKLYYVVVFHMVTVSVCATECHKPGLYVNRIATGTEIMSRFDALIKFRTSHGQRERAEELARNKDKCPT